MLSIDLSTTLMKMMMNMRKLERSGIEKDVFLCVNVLLSFFCIGEFPQCLFSNPFFYCPIFHIGNFLYHEEY